MRLFPEVCSLRGAGETTWGGDGELCSSEENLAALEQLTTTLHLGPSVNLPLHVLPSGRAPAGALSVGPAALGQEGALRVPG